MVLNGNPLFVSVHRLHTKRGRAGSAEESIYGLSCAPGVIFDEVDVLLVSSPYLEFNMV